MKCSSNCKHYGSSQNVRLIGISVSGISIIFFLVLGYFTKNDSIALYGTGFATVLLAGVTLNMVDEMRASRIEQSRPYIFVDFDIPYGEQLIHIIVKNIGGAAKNVQFKFDPELIDSRERVVSNGAIFKSGINFFPPNKEIKQLFDYAPNYFEKNLPLKFDLTVTYSDFKTEKSSTYSEKKQFEDTFALELSSFKDLQFVERKGLHEIAESMEQLVKDMRSQFKSQKDTSHKIKE
ncbi:MAG: hypothetical protein D4R88_00450 [Methanosarcinales archaeon]|nr:MAG: hypothetical protein D4R88_00450 [Methanosarcinales archaeon]